MADSLHEFVADELWLAVAVLTLPVAGLFLVAGIETLGLAVGIVGWFALTPLLLFWGEELADYYVGEDGDESTEPEADPLEALKARYARGEIDEATFERRLDRLVALDEVPDAATDALRSDDAGPPSVAAPDGAGGDETRSGRVEATDGTTGASSDGSRASHDPEREWSDATE